MSSNRSARPPYGAAVGVTLVVLVGYLLTLAPTVTFWDAGEFIAAVKTLGIPHPPGTPLFVLIGHVWAKLLPIGEYAFRTNLLSATFGAAAAGLFFLVAHESFLVAGGPARASGAPGDSDASVPRWLMLAGPAAAAIAGAFTFTNWQNSNETEVYGVATFTIAAMAWLALVWRRHRAVEETADRAARFLLLIVYLEGLSIGNHLLALLAGPAIVLFLVVTLRADPAPDPIRRRREWGYAAVMAGIWAMLVGTGLGSTMLTIVGTACFVAAAVFAATGGAAAFAALSLLLAAAGITPYLFMLLRAAQHPPINEAAPATIDALLAVIRREQYPVRSPLDDPTIAHGPNNPGRSLTVFAIQLADYLVYFSWQWAKSIPAYVGQVIAALGFLTLGIRGFVAHRRADRGTWWLLLAIFLITGIGLVLYMNFKPGFGRWFDVFPQSADHEVRERDYFFVVSFIVWGIWAGMGLATTAYGLLRRSGAARRFAPAVLALALVPVAFNWTAASRRQGPGVTLAADMAYNLLNSVPPYGVLFTYGDNDTFPLWWAQEVEGVRQDVTIVCLALANTDWYMRQLRDTPTRPLNEARLPAVWRDRRIPRPDRPLHTLDDSAIATALGGYLAQQTQALALGPVTRVLERGEILYPNEIVVLSIIREHLGRRPIVWSATTGRDFAGLQEYIVQRGLGYELLTHPSDSAVSAVGLRRLAGGPPIDVLTTERLLWDTYRYGGLLRGDAVHLDLTAAAFASSLAIPYTQLAYLYSYSDPGDRPKLERTIDRAVQLSPEPGLRTALESLRLKGK